MDQRNSLKEKELKHLVEEAKKHPELFKRTNWIENNKSLRRFGIYIQGKDALPTGYIKFRPEDFIVEEILPNGEACDISYENLLTSETQIETSPTIYATLVKCGLSTLEVIEDMARQLNCATKLIQYGGIKDKDAITSQRISFRNIPLENIKKIKSQYFFLKGVGAGKGVAEKGKILGNKFTIFIRTGESFFSDECRNTFVRNLESVVKNGFYNFYYLQRFGTPRLNNYLWALEIIKGNYEQAVRSFLTYQAERELPYFKQLRAGVKNNFGDWHKIKAIIAPFPLAMRNENRVVDYLISNPADYIGAFREISDQITLWVYALSSWLFNTKISGLIESSRAIPETLPLFLSHDSRDWMAYKELLAYLDILPPPFENLRPFSFIQLDRREIKTRERVKLIGADVTNEGLALSFELKTGDYATTLLAHLFNLITGKPPENLNPGPVDVKKVLGQDPGARTFEYFKPIIHSKAEDIFLTGTQ